MPLRPVLPRSATGLHERLIEEKWGRGVVEAIRRVSDYALPLPLVGVGAFAFRGEIYPIIGGGGFDSQADLEGKTVYDNQPLPIDKIGAGTSSSCFDTFTVGATPGAGAAPAALPGGTVSGLATVGAVGLDPPSTGKRMHFAGWQAATDSAHNAGGLAILYDQLWYGAITMNSTAAQSVTGTPTRYTGTASKGNVIWVRSRSTIAAVAHNHTITYVGDDGAAAEVAPVVTGISGAQSGRVDHNLGSTQHPWVPLNAGDLGVRNITNYTCSALVTSGTMDLVLARPLAMIPLSAAGDNNIEDVPMSMFNMAEINANACLSFMGLKGNTGGIQGPKGTLTLASG